MSEFERVESYRKNGFVIIPGVLNPEELQETRDLLRVVTNELPDNRRLLTISDLMHDPRLLKALLRIQFSEKLLATLREVIGEKFAYINDVLVQCNMFGLGGGWHVDAAEEVNITTNGYLYEPDYRFGKVGVYLQDNTPEFGGGIDVIPGSHKAFGFFGRRHVFQFAYRFGATKLQFWRARAFGKELRVPIKAGSAVFFDSRLFHRSTAPGAIGLDAASTNQAGRVKNEAIADDAAKYVFYWEACAPQNVGQFLENAVMRGISEEVGVTHKPCPEVVFSDYLSYYFPDDFPPEYVERVKQSGMVSVGCLDKHNAGVWKAIKNSFALTSTSAQAGHD